MLERWKAPLRRFRAYRALRFAWHFASDGVFRQDHVMWLLRPGNMFQYRSLTRVDRYPGIFSFLREQLRQKTESRLLSFGCATGEEVFSVRRYLPNAFLKGVDINPRNIAQCRARLRASGDARIEFACHDSADEEAAESYDAILCLAVFQHSALKKRNLATCERYIRFEAFDRTIAGLARALKPGGYLAIRHADFRFEDATCRAQFFPVMQIAPVGEPHPRFDRDNRRLPDEHDCDVVFQKRGQTGSTAESTGEKPAIL